MIIYPALDLREGRCVRLLQGDFNQQTNYHDSPVMMAEEFVSKGAEWLHIVDLDAAKDPNQNQMPLIKEIASVSAVNLQVGGGIRNAQRIEELLSSGVDRVVIGSLAVKQPGLVKQWLNSFGKSAITVALDVKCILDKFYVATEGWQETSHYELNQIIDFFGEDLQHLLCTDIARDGLLSGPNFTLYDNLVKTYPYLQCQASGGVAQLSDLKTLSMSKVAGVVVGKALYEKQFSLVEALQC